MSESPLLKRWQALQQNIDGMSLRERALVLLSAVAVVYMLWDVVIYSPVAEAKASVDKSLQETEQEIAALKQEEKVLLLTLGSDPDRELKMQRDDLRARVRQLDIELSELSAGLVPVDELANILQKVLEQTGVLRLQNLRTLPIEELRIAAAPTTDQNSGQLAGSLGDQSGDQDNVVAGVYKHTVELRVSGSYFQLLQYLHQLETMNWRFYWDELRFRRDSYPNGEIALRVYTLSTDEGLFGVE